MFEAGLPRCARNDGKRHANITVLDPLPNSIRFARFMVDSGLKQSKLIYKKPEKIAKVVGY